MSCGGWVNGYSVLALISIRQSCRLLMNRSRQRVKPLPVHRGYAAALLAKQGGVEGKPGELVNLISFLNEYQYRGVSGFVKVPGIRQGRLAFKQCSPSRHPVM